MANKAPDPRDFKSWEDAFTYPLPVVRRLEQSLRVSINENRDKLRTSVGASYRDLLGTADRIITMDDDMERLEKVLGSIGQKCNARSIERVGANQAKLAKVRRETVAPIRGLASEMALLQNCMSVISRMIKGMEKPLLAAKLLVLARLLHGSAAKFPDAPKLLDSLRTKLGGLRRRLLRSIDHQIGKADLESSRFVDVLTAFSLATSSTPTDVLRHLLHVRQEHLTELTEAAADGHIVQGLDIVFDTVRQIQAFFPIRVADALAKLKGFPLLDDADIRAIPELGLSIYERWISEDVRRYSPWPRHDELQSAQITQLLQPWSTNARKTIVSGLGASLSATTACSKIAGLRESVIRHLQSSSRDTKILNKDHLLHDLRKAFAGRLQKIIADASRTMPASIQRIIATGPNPRPQAVNVWDAALGDMDLRHGASGFRHIVVTRSLGHEQSLRNISHTLQKWSKNMESMRRTIKDMRGIRWNEDLDLDDDDEADAERFNTTLSKDDPDQLSARVDQGLNDAIDEALEHITLAASTRNAATSDFVQASFLLRLTRLIRRYQPASYQPAQLNLLLDTLYVWLAEETLNESIFHISRGPDSRSLIPFNVNPTVMLWEGTPTLPVQPSVTCMRVMHELRKQMQAMGGDLWTKAAVDDLKVRLGTAMQKSIQASVLDTQPLAVEVKNDTKACKEAEVEPSELTAEDAANMGEVSANTEQSTSLAPNGTLVNGNAASSERLRNIVIQTLFDVLYLGRLLATGAGKLESLQNLEIELREKSELDGGAVEKLRKSASDYHRRTSLLFGLLAPP